MPNTRLSKMQSIHSENPSITYMDKNGKNKCGLSLCEIIARVWCWLNEFKVLQVEKITNRCHYIVID